ncbi:ATP synthase F0 subunit B [Desulfotalea psychrophila]|uniref:ATP synthase subunit b n=1 Tax=Desulfotalea psychrophila TaxID=84980 RepID=A0ABS3AUD8_9BACT|nr:ATP synthase F0 subunit B [Desulfocapsa sp.]MBN4068714.1 ATP synthase F0 subunit B [Desulfotalea psychrophila]MBN4071561.1 ATP synthase F0 subunit B [Desulfotalea psychrophila]
MVSMDITVFFQIVNAFVLMFLLNGIIYKPVLKILKERKGKLQGMSNDVIKYEDNARRRQEEVDKKMHKASIQAKAAIDNARAGAKASGEEKIAAIKADTDAEKEKQLAGIKSQVEAARKDLEAGLDGFASAMAGKILGRSL